MIGKSREELLQMATVKAEEGRPGRSSEAAIACELAALRLTIAASLVPDVVLEELPDLGPVRLELFGHTVVWGHAREVIVAGKRFLELVQPAVEWEGEVLRTERTKRYSPNAVYAIEPTTDDEVIGHLRYAAGLWRGANGEWFKSDDDGSAGG